ncbi:MAG: cytochrome c-type biogenesis protein CcmH/NrfG [Alteromonadaceae bacterium]|jgi:cytochrome c-type biogenesis protein CcmH/NrfG
MSSFLKAFALLFCILSVPSFADKADEEKAQKVVDSLQKPLYSPFVERYVLDELKQLRIEQAQAKQELIQQIVDREHNSVDRGVSYATDTITYFFYLIAAATSVLVVVGWTSFRDVKERVHSLADEEIAKLVHEYEKRLAMIEKQLQQKTQHIEENREEIELTQDVQSLWLRAQQDPYPANKITIYDEILQLRHEDCEALTYKADAVLELNEPQWAASLCHQALTIDPDNSHAFYQLACAYTAMEQFDEALRFLAEAINRRDSYLEDIREDPALAPLINDEKFKNLVNMMNKSPLASSSQESGGQQSGAKNK